MPPPLTLKELMRLAYNAGGYRYTDGKPVSARGFDWWWEKYGQERHNDYAAFEEVDPEDRAKENS